MSKQEKLFGVTLIRWQHPECGTVSPGEFYSYCQNKQVLLCLRMDFKKELASTKKIYKVEGISLISS
jgi:EAL domain-containing protein (putative c-di-GMP-specific phosphodiesterase class I)